MPDYAALADLVADRLLIRAPNWLGDCIMALPSMTALHDRFPHAAITVAAQAPWDALYSEMDWVSDVVVIRRGKGVSGLSARFHSSTALRRQACQLSVIYPNSLGAAMESVIANVPIRVGYARRGRSPFLTHPVRADREILGVHQVLYYMRLAAVFTGAGSAPEIGDRDAPPQPRLSASDSARESARLLIMQSGAPDPDSVEPAVFAAGAAYGSAKEWPREHFAALAKSFYKKTGAKTILVGGPGEKEACSQIAAMSDFSAISIAGKTTIPQLIGVISRAKVFVGNDSGASHLAAALGVPTLVMFGSTKMTHTIPLGRAVATLNLHLDCAPCMKRVCPLSHRKCLYDITPDMASAALDELQC